MESWSLERPGSVNEVPGQEKGFDTPLLSVISVSAWRDEIGETAVI